MGWLKRAIKRNKKHLLKAGRLGLAAVTGGQSEAVLRVGALAKKVIDVKRAGLKLSKAPALQLAATALKYPGPKKHIDMKPIALPGGARIAGPKKPKKVRSVKKRLPKTRIKVPKDKLPDPKTGKRKAPGGGLDFAGMSRAWAAAGKPGTWRAWTSNKANQIRKAA